MNRRSSESRRLLAGALVLAGLLGAGWALGQGAEVPPEYRKYFKHYVDRRSLPEKALNLLGLTSQDAGRSFALIAGVDTYPNLEGADRRLEPAEVDMANLVDYLEKAEFFDEIVVLRNEAVDLETFTYFLQAYFPERLKRYPRSRFLFAYSGHGLQDGKRGYLLRSTARRLDDKERAISMEALRVLYSEVTETAFHSLALINACHSGGFGRVSYGSAKLVPKEPGAHVITAGGTAEKSWHYASVGPGSVFFEKLFVALGGRADTFPEQRDGVRGDGVVTVEELIGYLKPQVQQETEQAQNPILGDLDREGSRGSFFFLNRAWQVQARTAAEWKSVRRSMGPEPSTVVKLDPPPVASPPKPQQPGIVTRLQREQEYARATGSGWGPSTAGAVQVNSLGMRFRFIPAGRFWMGSPETEEGRTDYEGPRHEVELSRGFWLGETEVTQGQWSSVGGKNPSRFTSCGTSCPVEQVRWWEAVEFANRLSAREGLAACYALSGCKGTLGAEDFACASVQLKSRDCAGYRLPTESEWEYAARAGTSTALYTGKLTLAGERNGPELNPIAWYGGNSGVSYEGGRDCSAWPEKQFASTRCGPHPVGGKPANAWGLHDMLGNVWEWCWDFSGDYSSDFQRDPGGPSSGSRRVIRGGSWLNLARNVRAAVRSGDAPSDRLGYLGFRLARGQSAAPSEPGGGAPGQ